MRLHRIPSTLLFLTLGLSCHGCSMGSKPQNTPGTVYELGGERFVVQTVASDLVVPWAVAWLPDGRMLVTERPGRLRVLEANTHRIERTLAIDGVDHAGEHGLMGVAVSPRFNRDHLIFLSYTLRKKGLVNRIARFRLEGGALALDKVLIDDLPAGDYHDGLPLRFGPDGKLYASTGDAMHGELAQKTDSQAGKFLRMEVDGSAPVDNPFAGSLIGSLGHRNCQGFDWQAGTGRLYATEHGPSAPLDSTVGGGDELNWVQPGRNYGWPTYHHDLNAPGFEAPLKQWTPAIAPSGAAFYTGDKFPRWKGLFFFAALRGQALWYARFDPAAGGKIDVLGGVLADQFGRLRAVAMGPDGCLYLTTSNRDKRGVPASDDDRVLRLAPAGRL